MAENKKTLLTEAQIGRFLKLANVKSSFQLKEELEDVGAKVPPMGSDAEPPMPEVDEVPEGDDSKEDLVKKMVTAIADVARQEGVEVSVSDGEGEEGLESDELPPPEPAMEPEMDDEKPVMDEGGMLEKGSVSDMDALLAAISKHFIKEQAPTPPPSEPLKEEGGNGEYETVLNAYMKASGKSREEVQAEVDAEKGVTMQEAEAPKPEGKFMTTEKIMEIVKKTLKAVIKEAKEKKKAKKPAPKPAPKKKGK